MRGFVTAALAPALLAALSACGGASRPAPSLHLGPDRSPTTLDAAVAWAGDSKSLFVWRFVQGTLKEELLRVRVSTGSAHLLWRSRTHFQPTDTAPVNHAVSPDGRLIALAPDAYALTVVSTADGHVVWEDISAYQFDWSPNSRMIVANTGEGGSPLAVYRVRTRRFKYWTHRADGDPAWSPDGRWIAFDRGRKRTARTGYAGPTDVYVMAAPHGAPHLVTPLHERPLWSPDGRRLAALRSCGNRSHPARCVDVYAITPSGHAARRLSTRRIADWPQELNGDQWPYWNGWPWRWPLAWSKLGGLVALSAGSPILRAARSSLPPAAPHLFSPDGQWLAAMAVAGSCDQRGIWLISVATGRTVHLTRPCTVTKGT